MELIFHRANKLERIRQGIEAGFDRIEIDLRCRSGEFILSHDLPFGPWTFGRSGAQFGRVPFLLVRWEAPFVRLSDLLESNVPPLFIDLKGRWSVRSLGRLESLLERANRGDDIVGSENWDILDRCHAIQPERPLAYSLRSGELPKLMRQMKGGDKPFGVSVDAATLRKSGVLMDRLLDAELSVYAWNLQTKDELARLAQAGVAGAIFDDAGWT